MKHVILMVHVVFGKVAHYAPILQNKCLSATMRVSTHGLLVTDCCPAPYTKATRVRLLYVVTITWEVEGINTHRGSKHSLQQNIDFGGMGMKWYIIVLALGQFNSILF